MKRDDVRKITKAGKPVSRNVLIGALIGAGIGATAAAIVVSKSNDIDSPVTIPVNAAGWGGIGALIGYLASDRDWEAVYTAASH